MENQNNNELAIQLCFAVLMFLVGILAGQYMSCGDAGIGIL